MKRETKHIFLIIAGICSLPVLLVVGFFVIVVGRVLIRMALQ
jgi:hypothetical protein